MDSTTLLYHLLEEGDEVLAISFDYGQRHRKELGYAARTCERLGVAHRIADISDIGSLLGGSALTSTEIDVPDGHYEDPSMRITVVPNRNMILMAIAAGYAISEGCDRLAVAVHAGDHAVYPDCRPEFVDRFEKALETGNYENILVYAPFISWKKDEIARLGTRLGIDYERDTWSCYKGGEEPCGKCGTCVERAEALAAAGKDEESG
jgi:7-cyano-7-deazaguanine synthase